MKIKPIKSNYSHSLHRFDKTNYYGVTLLSVHCSKCKDNFYAFRSIQALLKCLSNLFFNLSHKKQNFIRRRELILQKDSNNKIQMIRVDGFGRKINVHKCPVSDIESIVRDIIQ